VAVQLVVSPHLDDAVLSIGGSIAAWVAAGDRVVIASVYTTGPPLSEITRAMRKFADYATRCAEDTAACATLGAEVRWLDQVERAFRRPFLAGTAYFTTPPERAGFTALAEVTRALEPLRALDPERIFVPLGIGNHVDHVEALIAATDWAIASGLGDRLVGYEDFYALSGTLRRRHPVARAEVWPRWRSPLLHARRLAAILRLIGATGRGPGAVAFLAPTLRGASWQLTRSDVRATESQKLAAIACYGSQTRAFGGFAGIARATRAYHAWWGGAEPLWRPTT
jgi:LmbE family N-acetylglucosaminyl deacetylase